MMFLFIFVWDEKCVSFEVALMDLETGLVGNPDAIPECRGARMKISGHVMSTQRARRERE
jgi:hypothetical protein